jgi:lipopolysaccharide assembly outer membrane protein LptD (OstA)
LAPRLSPVFAILVLAGCLFAAPVLGQGFDQAPDQEPAETEGATPPEAEPAEPPDDPDRIDFTLQLEDGQGTVTGGARSLEFQRENYAVLSGQVEIRHEDFRLRADSVEVDLATQDVIALGSVIMDQGPRRLSGKTMTFNLESETGTLTEASAFVDPDYYFTGREISKVGEGAS